MLVSSNQATSGSCTVNERASYNWLTDHYSNEGQTIFQFLDINVYVFDNILASASQYELAILMNGGIF